MLRGAGFERIAFERYDCDICIGSDMDDAIEFAMALGPAGEIIRLAGDEGAKRSPRWSRRSRRRSRPLRVPTVYGRRRGLGSLPRLIPAERGNVGFPVALE